MTRTKTTAQTVNACGGHSVPFIILNESFLKTPFGRVLEALNSRDPETISHCIDEVDVLRATITSVMAVMSDYAQAEHNYSDGIDEVNVYQFVASLNEFCTNVEKMPSHMEMLNALNPRNGVCK